MAAFKVPRVHPHFASATGYKQQELSTPCKQQLSSKQKTLGVVVLALALCRGKGQAYYSAPSPSTLVIQVSKCNFKGENGHHASIFAE